MFNYKIFEQLEKEHKEVKSLFSEAERAAGRNRQKLLKEIEEALIPHARGEEKTLYALLLEESKKQNNEDGIKCSEEAYEEHRVVDELLAELKDISVNDETWLARLTVIKENIEHHIDEEEGQVFKTAKAVLSKDTLENLDEAYLEVKEKFSQTLPSQGEISERVPTRSARSA